MVKDEGSTSRSRPICIWPSYRLTAGQSHGDGSGRGINIGHVPRGSCCSRGPVWAGRRRTCWFPPGSPEVEAFVEVVDRLGALGVPFVVGPGVHARCVGPDGFGQLGRDGLGCCPLSGGQVVEVVQHVCEVGQLKHRRFEVVQRPVPGEGFPRGFYPGGGGQ